MIILIGNYDQLSHTQIDCRTYMHDALSYHNEIIYHDGSGFLSHKCICLADY